jgi:DNA-binding PadR family transcriptional regulator
MEKKSRSSSAPEPDPIESDSPRPQGAPRGLLQFYALFSIARRPMRGYDLIKEIETKTEGAWRPGPGAVYPMLRKLEEQGYIAVKKKTGGRATQVLYEITPEGLENVANTKKMMRSSTERWNLMGSLFLDLMEPEDLVKFALTSLELQIEVLHTIVESTRSGLSDQDKLFVLRQYRLNLERELTKAQDLIETIEAKRSKAAIAGGGEA